MIKDSLGNTELLKLPKTAFLCSRQVPASVVLKCYDWAIEQREKGNCVISGFHSQIEKDVLHYLLKCKQPIILALARGLKEKSEPEFENTLEQGRLLIITPFDKTIKRVSSKTAQPESTRALKRSIGKGLQGRMTRTTGYNSLFPHKIFLSRTSLAILFNRYQYSGFTREAFIEQQSRLASSIGTRLSETDGLMDNCDAHNRCNHLLA